NHFLVGSAIPSADVSYALSLQLLAKIGLTEVNAAAKAMVIPNNQIVVVQAPEGDKDKLPTEAALLAAIKTAGNGVKPYVDNTVNKPLIAQAPKAGTIVSEEKNDKIGITSLT